jgi:hypothetical protein
VPLAIALHLVSLARLRTAASPTQDRSGQVVAPGG